MKKRKKIPDEIASEILFLSDRTCCICNVRGRSIQIHHIDDDPSNNKIENLSVICLECHNDTMISGGFGRKLESNQVIKFKNDWLDRVQKRKIKADEIASIQTIIRISNEKKQDKYDFKENSIERNLCYYLDAIQKIKKARMKLASKKWASGNTSNMTQGCYDLIDFYEKVLIEISTFYQNRYFEEINRNLYFNKLISNRFHWYRILSEPEGEGSRGTIINNIIANKVMIELDYKVIEMVNSLSQSLLFNIRFNTKEWEVKWKEIT